MNKSKYRVEWPTLGLILATYGLWLLVIFGLSQVSLWLAVPLAGILAGFHSSLTHEVIHGHPFRSARLNAALVYPALSLFVPFDRFRDTHLAHHTDSRLTDPYDDPESNYMDPGDWETLSPWLQVVLRANNTMFGRLMIGPLIGHIFWLRGDARAIRAGDRVVMMGWLRHVPAMALVLAAVWASPMPVWAYLISGYLSLSLLKIRTFLEHQAHEKARGRTVIIEDRGPLGFLFLNNNLHVVHHMHPRVPWYRLWTLYRANPVRYLSNNNAYRFRSYGEVFAKYLFKPKDPVPHPLWRRQ